ncbi:MAG: MFS transporter [Anaerolineales bacterium]|nr:MFS transporter [Anaerolineales bacterium]
MNRNLILMALSLMTWGVGEGMFIFFQPLYLQELGASPVEIGGILGIMGLAMTVAHLPAGFLADRIGRRPMIIAAWLLGTLSAWIMALSNSLPVFIIGNTLYGLTAFVVSPMNSYITAARGSLSVGRVLTLISATYNVGSILGPLLGGWIGNRAGLKTNFLVAACIFMVSAAIVFFLRPQPVQPRQEEPGQRSWRNSGKAVLTPRFVQFLAIVFIATFSMFLPQQLSPNFLQNERGINLAQMGQLLAGRAAGVVVLNLVVGQMNARVGFLLAHLGIASFATLLWQGGGFPAYALGYFLLGSYHTARSMVVAQGRTLVNAANMGLAYGMIETTAAMVVILAPPLAGILYDLDPPLVYPISLGLIGFSLIMALFFSPVCSRDMRVELPEEST